MSGAGEMAGASGASGASGAPGASGGSGASGVSGGTETPVLAPVPAPGPAMPPAACPRCGYERTTTLGDVRRCPECGLTLAAGSILLPAESVREAAWFPRRGVAWLAIGGAGFLAFLVLLVIVILRMRGGGGGSSAWWLVFMLINLGPGLLLVVLRYSPRAVTITPSERQVVLWGRSRRTLRLRPGTVHSWSISWPETGAVHVWFRTRRLRRFVVGRFRLEGHDRDGVRAAIESALDLPPQEFVGDPRRRRSESSASASRPAASPPTASAPASLLASPPATSRPGGDRG